LLLWKWLLFEYKRCLMLRSIADDLEKTLAYDRAHPGFGYCYRD